LKKENYIALSGEVGLEKAMDFSIERLRSD